MKLKIGETIKKFRKEREITQEEFAEVLGVSCQSVSRWENGLCYPDVELIPSIAGFFGVSVDKLIGVDDVAERQAVEHYLSEFQNAISHGAVEECIRIAREGVAEFPNNYALLNKLMYALFVAGSNDADIPNWKENMENYDAEIVALGERIMRYCPDVEIRSEATVRLAFQHCEMGRKEIGRSIYKTLPTMESCRESAIWWALAEEEKLPHTRTYISTAYAHLWEAICRLIVLLPDEEAVLIFEKMDALESLMYDNAPRTGTWSNANFHFEWAKYLLKLGRQEEAFEQLRCAAEAAIAFDNRPEEEKTVTRLFGKVTHRRSDFDTADSRPLKEIVRDMWLAEKVFDAVRETKEFRGIIKRLG